MEDNKVENSEIEKGMEDRFRRLLFHGVSNSALLSITFAIYTAGGYVSGNYWIVGLGALATFFTLTDAIDFYKFRKNTTVSAKVVRD